ncbi:MAG: type II secretion system protein [Armatimonadetes bacterium]|nr:type II secretion system protein [Armatimonadota bacterium]NOG92784.1 type II secretion system protein [Armatimonadota bacterium]
MRVRESRAFTLIELIVVIAITSIVLTIITIPLLQAFRLTRAGQAFSEAQSEARNIVEQMNKELSTAVLVLDNTRPESSVEVQLPLSSDPVNPAFANQWGSVFLYSGKIDMVPAAKGDPGNPLFNPGRNRTDPTLKAPVGQVTVPVAPGFTIVRYWVGLKRPYRSNGASGRYANPWVPQIVGADEPSAGETDENLHVLYRAEVAPWIWDQASGRYVANTAFFPIDGNGNPVIDDPGFFCWEPLSVYDNLNAHRLRLRNWKATARIVTPDRLTDLVQPVYDEATGIPVYDDFGGGLFIPRVRSLVRFQPVSAKNEPATSNPIQYSGVEIVDPEKRSAPVFFSTQMAAWTKDTVVRYFPEAPTLNLPYFIARWRPTGPGFFDPVISEIAYFDPAVNSDPYTQGSPVFDLGGYQAALAAGGPVALGNFLSPPPGPNTPLMLFRMDSKRGRIALSFPADQALGYVPQTTGANVNATLDGWIASPTGGQNANTRALGRRFVALDRFTPSAGNYWNPLQASALYGYDNQTSKVVPGSERVIGPDQRPGPNFGRPIRYSRVAQGHKVGANQYLINYVDLDEPSDYMTALGVPDPSGNADVANYIQPRFKKGYVEFNSDPNVPLPDGNITISFDFQLNESGDSIAVDYDSLQQIRVELTILRYAGAAGAQPQSALVKDVVTVRNFQK